jgi:hypothetical protein
MSTRKRKEGRVAQILNERELVINIGSKSGVTPGMRFAVLSESPTEIKDPQTGEILDVVDREKVKVEAAEVREKIAVCRTYVKRTIPGGVWHLQGLRFKDPFAPPQEVVETLKASDKSMPPPLSPEESYVKINDRVIEITKE